MCWFKERWWESNGVHTLDGVILPHPPLKGYDHWQRNERNERNELNELNKPNKLNEPNELNELNKPIKS